MVQGVEQDLGLLLVGRDVVRDLRRPDLAVLVALADRELLDDRRVVGDGLVELRDHLGVGVVAGVLRGEIRGGDGRDGGHEGEQQETGKGGGEGTHGAKSDRSDLPLSPRDGASRAPDARS